MNLIENILAGIEGGRVLDVATQEGGFVQILIDNLKGYTEIVGIDIDERSIAQARENIVQDSVRFLVMNAERLDFEHESFDTVSISASLHHLSYIPQVLHEMERVLKSGGHFLLVEMHRDGQTSAELTSVYLHHWVAEVDTKMGHLHNSTLSLQEFTGYIAPLRLSYIEFHHHIDHDSDPFEKTRIEQLEGLIDRTIQRLAELKEVEDLRARGEQLRQRLHAVGAQREPIILILGKK